MTWTPTWYTRRQRITTPASPWTAPPTIWNPGRSSRDWFTEEEIEVVAQAAEDHRASAKTAPRSIYGRLIAEADRLIDPLTIIRRTIQFGLSHYPELDPEGHWERTLEHLREKYGDRGYLQLWIPESPNAGRLEELRKIIRKPETLRSIFGKLFAEETATGPA